MGPPEQNQSLVTEITLSQTSPPAPNNLEASKPPHKFGLGAGFRRLFSPQKSPEDARPGPSRMICRGAEKETHLARRRGGGTTARARC